MNRITKKKNVEYIKVMLAARKLIGIGFKIGKKARSAYTRNIRLSRKEIVAFI